MITHLVPLLWVALLAPAQTAHPDITLGEAIARACARSQAFQAAQTRTQTAELNVKQSRKALLPSLQTQASVKGQTERMAVAMPTGTKAGPYIFSDASLGVSMPLLSGGRLQARIDLSRQALGSSQDQNQLSQAAVAHEVRGTLIQLQLLSSTRQSVQARIDRLKRHRLRLEELFVAGLCSMADRIEAEQKETELTLAALDLSRQIQALSDAFRDLCGLNPDQVVWAGLILPRGEERDRLIADHPTVRLKIRQAESALSATRLKTAEYRPQVSLFGEVHGGNPGVNMLASDWSLYGVAGVRLGLTLFDFHQKRDMEASGELERRQASFEASRQKEELQARVENLEHQIASLEEQITPSKRLLELARSFLEHQKRLWEAAQLSHTDVLNAMDRLGEEETRIPGLHWQQEALRNDLLLTLSFVLGE